MFKYDLIIFLGVVALLLDAVCFFKFFLIDFKESEKSIINWLMVIAMSMVVISGLILVFQELEIKQNVELMSNSSTMQNVEEIKGSYTTEGHKVFIRAHIKDIEKSLKYDIPILVISFLLVFGIRYIIDLEWKNNFKKHKGRWNLENH